MRGTLSKRIRRIAKEKGLDERKIKADLKKKKRNPKLELAPKNLLMVHFNREMPSAYKRPLKTFRHILKVENAKVIVDKIVNRHPEHLNVDLAVYYNDKRVPSIVYEKPKPKEEKRTA